ncbi:ABC transporter substrate-binding protein [Allorhizocola rhizosphaerae]|uniref:ABC transporter substrate-binding protein n=1 Tax=Allorhizocola rhizosphaerae TaxID=1872709 RepID=UPI000E3E8C6E|nr:ABC transporter substrate-binding protein [Allorhizocola rhizosphaerae]
MRVAVAVVAALALAAAGCTQAPSGNNGGNTDIGGTQEFGQDPNAKGPAPEIPGAKKGGTITVYSESTPNTFDPTDIYYVDSNEIGKLIFRTPTQFAIRNGNAVLVPDLTDLGTMSADGLKWTFKMKTGLKYADGTEIKVEDLAYAIKRSFDHEAYHNGPAYQLSYFKGGDTYKGPYNSGDNCECVETPDASTLVINLKEPFNDLPYYMTFPMFTPIPKAKDTKAEYKNNPVASGPYQFDTFTPGTELKLKRNPNWDAASDPVRHAYPDAWVFKWGESDVKTQQQVLNSNGADANALNYANIDASLIPELDKGDKKKQLIAGTSPCTIVWQLDTRKITDINIRKAIAKAFPYDQIWKAAGNNDLTAQPANTVMPPSVQGYKNYPAIEDLDGKGTGDPAAAKKMLEAAGKVGYELSWYYNNASTQAQQVNQARVDAFTAAGFTVKPIGVTAAELRAKRGDYNAPVNMGQTPAGWCSDWPTGSSWFPVLFRSQSIAEGQSWGMLSDPALDAKINDVAKLPSKDAAAKWADLDKEIMEKYIVMPLYYDKMAIVVGTNVGGAVGDGTMGMPFFVDMFLKS